jgi:hypothetical protein
LLCFFFNSSAATGSYATVHTLSLRAALPIAGAQQPAALPQQTVAVVVLFAIQTEQICVVTFLHYHFSGFS